ncbi:YafY family protein [Prevotella sp. P6B1]|uniref:helix-turn-helix transcriptional regulator n=1 Tax=Prevotella sp. P6B1 TaxID=1410613 RepID=UPI00051BE47B|nr:WYL domain-containing protein [Prevotella sp. P6B1]
MPVDKQVLLRYQVLNKCFRNRYREYTIDDLVDECNNALRRADKPDVSKRTVQNDINQLEVDYHIVLDENLRQGRKRLYRYVDTNYTLPIYRMNDEERNKIEGAIYVLKQFGGEPIYDWASTILMQIEGGLFDGESSPVVSFQTNLDLKGLTHFNKLLQAILNRRVLKLRYTPYGKSQITTTIYPYHLKEYNDRWYLIAQAKGYNSFAHYALDRIDDFEEVAINYKEAEVEFDDYFDDVIGVTVPEEESEDIMLRISKPRFEYIRTKPLHLSQRIIEDNAEFAIISINVKINKELEALLLSYGNDIEVLSPVRFREQIKNKILLMNQKYMSDAENLQSK